jgi:hypothetical protein
LFAKVETVTEKRGLVAMGIARQWGLLTQILGTYRTSLPAPRAAKAPRFLMAVSRGDELSAIFSTVLQKVGKEK